MKKLFCICLVVCKLTLFCGCDGSSTPLENQRHIGIRNLTNHRLIEVRNKYTIIDKGDIKYFWMPGPGTINYCFNCQAGGKKAIFRIYNEWNGKVYPNFNTQVYDRPSGSGIEIRTLFRSGMILNLIEVNGQLILTNL